MFLFVVVSGQTRKAIFQHSLRFCGYILEEFFFFPNLACFASLRESSFPRFRNPKVNGQSQLCLVNF